LPVQVEDMRLIIHNLGKFLSHRDVKVRIVLLYLLSTPPLPNQELHTCADVLFVVCNGLFWHQELVQSALLESNTGRDDRILYNKLVRMTGV